MKLRTSFFNFSVLRKDITRFSPLWGLYTVAVLVYLLLVWAIGDSTHMRMYNLPHVLSSMAFVNLLYAGINAMMLFGDLYKSRLCNALHAMPLRREGWFLTHMVSGLLFCIVPNLLGALIGAALLGQHAYGAGLWLGLMVLEYLVFFGIGVFSAMCAGTKLGMAAIYCLINFLAVLAAWLVSTFYEPLLYGVSVDMSSIYRFSPVFILTDTPFLETEYLRYYEKTILQQIPWDSWLTLGLWAIGGIVFSGLALLLYRKRNLERAGDLITFRPAGFVFLVLYTLCVAAVLFFITSEITGPLGYLFLFIGLGVGFFTGRMLMEKRVQVFRGKNFLSFGILVAAFALTMVLSVLDPLGITRYVPRAEQVESIHISPYYGNYYTETDSCELTQEADIHEILSVHEQALDLRFTPSVPDEHVRIRYTLKNGRTVTRHYDIPFDGPARETLQEIYSRPEYVLGNRDMDLLLKRLSTIDFYPYNNDHPYIQISRAGADTELLDKFGDETVLQYPAEGSLDQSDVAVGLLKAILADCEAGKLSQHNHRDNPVGYLNMEWASSTAPLSITVYTISENTLAYLAQLQKQHDTAPTPVP